jgi:MerR family transcriptional regulator, copper efflux regulator
MQRLSIGKLAKAANVSIDTIRFYEKSGLLPRAARRPSGYREYSDLDLVQLQFVRRARAAGFSLEEIGKLLTIGDEVSATRDTRVIDRALEVIDRKITELEHWRKALNALASSSSQPRSKHAILLHFTAERAADSSVAASEGHIHTTIHTST